MLHILNSACTMQKKHQMLRRSYLLPPRSLDLKLSWCCSRELVEIPQGSCFWDGHGLFVSAIRRAVDLVEVWQAGVIHIGGFERSKDLHCKTGSRFTKLGNKDNGVENRSFLFSYRALPSLCVWFLFPLQHLTNAGCVWCDRSHIWSPLMSELCKCKIKQVTRCFRQRMSRLRTVHFEYFEAKHAQHAVWSKSFHCVRQDLC